MKTYILSCIIFCLIMQAQGHMYDFETNTDAFVLETKQIIIPEFTGGFNPALVTWKGKKLLCFRVRNEHLKSTFQMAFVWLDEQFAPISRVFILDIRGHNPSELYENQDPRLLTIDNTLYIVYSNTICMHGKRIKRMLIAPVNEDKQGFFIQNPVLLNQFEGSSQRWEKNWAPFDYKGNLLLAYSIVPHKIFKPSLINGSCLSVCSTSCTTNWNWGHLRGGTPAMLDGDQYIAFFHSSTKVTSVHSEGKAIPHYFMGAYTFSAYPPFEITAMSSRPILGKNFYNGPAHNTWKPLRVVFPVGCIMDNDHIWVSYGKQDHEMWIAKLDKRGLLDSLTPCANINDIHYTISDTQPISSENTDFRS